jgi:hypothetical protein
MSRLEAQIVRKILWGAGLVFLALVVTLAAVAAPSPYLRRIALLGNVDIRDYDKLPFRTIERSAARPDTYANGHFGQRPYVSPARGLVLLRLGGEDGGVGWTGFLASIAARFGEVAGR